MNRASPADLRLPPHTPGQRIGLFGGSFNPAHAGHALVAITALKRLRLDRVWMLATPGNPLKDNHGLPPLAVRIAQTRATVTHPRILVTGLEAALGSRFSADTIATLQARCPQARFVWIMGADNLAGFHRWERWDAIAARVPIAVVDRPGATLAPMSAPAARAMTRWRLDESDAALLADRAPPAWVFLHGPRSTLSSTALRGE